RGAGEQVDRPSRSAVQRAVADLARRGLVVPIGSREALVFSMPMAATGSVTPNRNRASSGRVPGGVNRASSGRYNDVDSYDDFCVDETETGRVPGGFRASEPGQHQGSRIKVYTPQAASTALTEGGAPAGQRAAVDGLAEEQGPEMARAIEIVTMLRREGARLNAMDPRVLGWVRDAVSDAVLLAAMSAAQERRSSEGSAQPIGSGLLDVLVRDAHDRAEGRRPKARWWATDAGVVEEGRRLGLEAAIGESMDDFKARIKSAQSRGVVA
ncbi:MAG: hypothetical protein KDH16_22490, partial [Rhodocyclaceae bacterium]|nr:hypothetical protein [Rhodocyclaceae bacterium]